MKKKKKVKVPEVFICNHCKHEIDTSTVSRMLSVKKRRRCPSCGRRINGPRIARFMHSLVGPKPPVTITPEHLEYLMKKKMEYFAEMRRKKQELTERLKKEKWKYE